MAAQSDNKYDVFNWIMKVYDSCENISQLMTAERLADNFENRYDDHKLNSVLHDYWIKTYDTMGDRKREKQLLKG